MHWQITFIVQVAGSVSAEVGLFAKYKFGLKVDTEVFDDSLTSGTKFGNKSYTFKSGGEDLPGKK